MFLFVIVALGLAVYSSYRLIRLHATKPVGPTVAVAVGLFIFNVVFLGRNIGAQIVGCVLMVAWAVGAFLIVRYDLTNPAAPKSSKYPVVSQLNAMLAQKVVGWDAAKPAAPPPPKVNAVFGTQRSRFRRASPPPPKLGSRPLAAPPKPAPTKVAGGGGQATDRRAVMPKFGPPPGAVVKAPQAPVPLSNAAVAVAAALPSPPDAPLTRGSDGEGRTTGGMIAAALASEEPNVVSPTAPAPGFSWDALVAHSRKDPTDSFKS